MFSLKLLAQRLVQHSSSTMTRTLFVQNARSLERIKNKGITDELIQNGRFLVLCNETVLVDPLTKAIAWKTKESKKFLDLRHK